MSLLGIYTSTLHLEIPSLPCLAADIEKTTSKTLKAVLFHQNDHHRAKSPEVALFIFRCDHFEGNM